jgi:hypothetical protein
MVWLALLVFLMETAILSLDLGYYWIAYTSYENDIEFTY